MKTCIYLSYKGLGANLLHLAYCHEIARKYGPVTIITLCGNLEATLMDDPLIKKVIFINKYHKRFIDILKLKGCKNFLKFVSIIWDVSGGSLEVLRNNFYQNLGTF